MRLIRRFNDLERGALIELDELDGLQLGTKPGSIACIFENELFQYDLRGDPLLWRELKEYFRLRSVPGSEEELQAQIHTGIYELTSRQLSRGKNFYVERYNEGGMSGGIVCSDFWLQRGIPLLTGRFRKMKESW